MRTPSDSKAAKAVTITQLACDIAGGDRDPHAAGFEKLRLVTVAKIAGRPSKTSETLTEAERQRRLNDAQAALEGIPLPNLAAIQRGTLIPRATRPVDRPLGQLSFTQTYVSFLGKNVYGDWLGLNSAALSPLSPVDSDNTEVRQSIDRRSGGVETTEETKTDSPDPPQPAPGTGFTSTSKTQAYAALVGDAGDILPSHNYEEPPDSAYAHRPNSEKKIELRKAGSFPSGPKHDGCPIVTPSDEQSVERPSRFPITVKPPADKRLRDLRADFINKYSVKVLGAGKVSVILPADVSAFQVIEEGRGITAQLGWPGVHPNRIEKWSEDPIFNQPTTKETVIAVEGGVPGSTNKNITKQINEGYVNVDVSELAVAAIAYFLATGEDFFSGFDVRALRDTLRLSSKGLEISFGQHLPLTDVRAARRLTSEETGITLDPPAFTVAPDATTVGHEDPLQAKQLNPEETTESEESYGDRVEFQLPESLHEKELITSFISDYDVQSLGSGRVKVVLPQGKNPLDLIERAQEIATDLHWPGVREDLLSRWRSDTSFTTPSHEPITITVETSNVASSHLTFEEQVAMGFNDVTLPELAVAHLAYLMTTGRDLFYGCSVRAQGGTLVFRRDGGLQLSGLREDKRYYSVLGSKRLKISDSPK